MSKQRDKLDWESLRSAATLLSEDWCSAQQSKYEDAWKQLALGLSSYESTSRSFTMKIICMIGNHIPRCLVHLKVTTTLVSLLTTAVASEENPINRCLAAQALGFFIPAMMKRDFPSWMRKNAFEVVLGEFLNYFPRNLTDSLKDNPDQFDVRTIMSSRIFQARVQLIHAISRFFGIPEAQDDQLLHYFDILFSKILKSQSHHILQTAVIQVLHDHYDLTNRNRIRVDTFFRKPIMGIHSKILPAKQEEIGSSHQAIDHNSETVPSSERQPHHGCLQAVIHKFFSKWYPRPSDATLLSLKADEKTSQFILSGYTARRRQKLLEGIDDAATLKPEDRMDLLEKHRPIPYTLFRTVKLPSSPFGTRKPSRNEGDASIHSLILDDSSEEVSNPNAVSIKASVAFKSAPKILEFATMSFTTTLFLENASQNEDAQFFIQSFPSQYFQVIPSVGVLPKGGATPVKVTFSSRPFGDQICSEIKGYLRVRTEDGFPLERLALVAYNSPSLKITPTELNFGTCPPNEERTMIFTVTNLLPIHCTVVMVLNGSDTESGSAFHVSQSQLILRAYETRTLSVSVYPDESQQRDILQDELFLIAHGKELFRIRVSAQVGHSLYVVQRKLDFGPTDIYFNAAEKRIHLINRDRSQSLPVYFNTSSTEIIVNKGQPVVLEPGEERAILVEFLAALSGNRAEQITIFAPNSPDVLVEVFSACGPMVHIPLHEEVFFPAVSVGEAAVIEIPFTNTTTSNLLFVVTVPSTAPIHLSMRDPGYANRDTDIESFLLESKIYETTDLRGLLITASPKATAILEINCKPTLAGNLRIPLVTLLMKPKKMEIARHVLNAIAITDTTLTASATVPSIRNFVQKPHLQPISLFKPNTGSGKVISKPCHSTVFQLYPQIQIISGPVSKTRSVETVDFISLINISHEPQKFRIALSYQFVTDVPLDGRVPPSTTLNIPIRINPDLFMTPEGKQQTIYGSITVFDFDYNSPGMVTSHLIGVVNHLVCVEVRDNVTEIKFPNLNLMENSSRQIVLRNKTNVQIPWEGLISNLDVETVKRIGISSATLQTKDTWQPFSISHGKLFLKPFESLLLNISFFSSTAGDFATHFVMSYEKPVDDMNNVHRKSNQNQTILGSWLLRCAVGHPILTSSPDYLSFGDVSIGSTLQLALSLSNAENSGTWTALAIPSSLSTAKSNFFIPANTKEEVVISCTPLKTGYISSTVSFNIGGLTHAIPVSGFGGLVRVESNPMNPIMVDNSKTANNLNPVPENTIDFGFISPFSSKRQLFEIRNAGTLDLIIHNIKSGDGKWLSVQLIDPNVARQTFGSDLTQYEIDWDDEESKEFGRISASSSRQSSRHSSAHRQSIASASTMRKKLAAKSSLIIGRRPIEFPLRVLPNQVMYFDLVASCHEKSGVKQGPISTTLEAEIQQTTKSRQTLLWWVKGCVQIPLEISAKKFDLGTCPIGQTQTFQLKIINSGPSLVNWNLKDLGSRYAPLSKFNPKPLPAKGKYLPTPVTYYPKAGSLKPRTIQIVDISFTPSIPQYDIFTNLCLNTEDISQDVIQIRGTGASSEIIASTHSIDFGVLRVGMKKEMSFEIRNLGALSNSVFIETTNVQFEPDPEQVKLGPDGKTTVRVYFLPKHVGTSKAILKITQPSNRFLEPKLITLQGTGSYPELVVLSRLIDFGTALFKNPNRRSIKVQNKGAAEATVLFHCLHPDITLEDESGSGNPIVIGPYTTRDLFILFTPQTVEKLDIRAYIRSSDARSDNFMITLKGSVGVPRLTVTPPNALEDLDFGVMRLNKSYKKTFKIMNDGNIFLSFNTALEPLSLSYLAVDADFDAASRKPLSSITPPITIEPSAGTLGVGQEALVTVTFTPNMLVNYEYRFLLNYDFQSLRGVIMGTGGRAMLRLDSPNTIFDFGLCRVGRLFKKIIGVCNQGNLGFKFHIRPEPKDGNWSIYDEEIATLMSLEAKTRVQTPASGNNEEIIHPEYSWQTDLLEMGIRILEADGYCAPSSRFELHIEFNPKSTSPVSKDFRIYFGDHFETFQVKGAGGYSSLLIVDPSSKTTITKDASASLDIGVHPVNSVYSHTFHLVNDGPFPVDFLAQPMSSAEYDIYPSRGFVEPGDTFPLKIFFKPNSESIFHTTFKVLWEGKSVRANITGRGGIGRLEIGYVEDKDKLLKGLDFGMVPFNSACEKRLFLLNYGMVGVYAHLEVDNEEYAITQFSDPIPVEEAKKTKPHPKGIIFTWLQHGKFYVPPNSALDVGARFLARSATTSVGSLTVRSEAGNFVIPLKGKGGTISLSHRGDLDFGDMSCHFTYSRKITIVNGGSIPSKIHAKWLVVGQSGEPAPLVKLTESYTPLDPRSGWARQYYIKEKGGTDFHRQLTIREYWQLLKIMVRKSMIKEEARQTGRSDKRVTGSDLNTTFQNLGLASQPSMMRKVSMAGVSHHFKRRQMFYHLITSTQLSSQSSDRTRPFVKVDPPSGILPSYGEFVFNVELHLASEDTFLGTLIVKSEVPNTKEHEISLTATPKLVNVVCDDTRMLNFYRQPLGETEIIQRSFTNVGHKDINFRFINSNIGLSIAPSKGVLKVGQTVQVAFAFRPPDESIQTSEVIFDPIISQPIRFKMYGGGGYAKASLARYRRFDFGHCMIGKDTISYLPIVNEGNAILHLTRFEIHESDTFFRGQDWPKGRISLFPGTSFNLSMVFNPHEENPRPGRLTVCTSSETYDIELIGAGREAVLIVSKVALEFTECLIGNSYEQRLGLKNVGDVNYPVTFQLEKEFPDIDFYPRSLVIHPFSENFVSISYTPTHETRATVVLTISSPYSTHKVPVMVHSGTASLEFNTPELDFGLFERTTRPSMKLTIRNTGTVRTSFHAKDTNKPSMFQITPAKGMLLPNKSMEVMVTHIKHEVAQFQEKLMVRTDLVDKFYYVSVVGQCEETVLHPDEFSMVNMGICPVLESTTKPLTFKNYGRFPLEFSIKSAYPLKVSPSQGRVGGLESGTIYITWNPSGGYELRTQITMVTNIGKFQVVVRGKAMTPEMHVSSTYVDFGVCAAGYTYQEQFSIENKGKVPVYFTIPPCKDGSFRPSVSNGILAAKETMPVTVSFTPASIGKFTSSVLVECKGIHYKEVVVAGVGGVMKVDIQPQSIHLGRCPFELQVYEVISITNLGDVTLHFDFRETIPNQDAMMISVPDPIEVGPKRTVKCTFGFSALIVGPISGVIQMRTKEETYKISVSGTGIRIILSKTSKMVLESEHLPTLDVVGPLHSEIAFPSWDLFMKRFTFVFYQDMKIASLISWLLQGESNSNEQISSLVTRPKSPPKQTNVRPTVAVIESVDLTSNSAPNPDMNERKPPESMQDNDEIVPSTRPSIALPQPAPLPPIGTKSLSITEIPEPVNEGKDTNGPESEVNENTMRPQIDTHNIIVDKRGEILSNLGKIKELPAPIDRSVVETSLSEFIDIKTCDYEPPVVTDDPVAHHVIDFGHLKIEAISMDEILMDQEPNLEQDLSFLLTRPKAIIREDHGGMQNLAFLAQKRKDYTAVYPSLRRKSRNAKTDPFLNRTRPSIYGTSVSMYPPYFPG